LSKAFADPFCSVRKQRNPDGGNWGGCEEYLKTEGREDVALGKIPTTTRILIVPGFFNTCASDAPAFAEGQAALKQMGLTVERLSVPNNSSEDNAKEIAAYLREKTKTDKRPYLLVGYSKGTPDIQVMLATNPEVRPMVAAFVSVAGASGGSPVADTLPSILDRYMSKGNDKAGCKGAMEAGMASLKREVRSRFLTQYPHPFVPTYSMWAVAEEAKLSGAMKKTWSIMNSFDRENDGQLAKMDAIVPESKLLGGARSDHFALALPLEKSKMGAMSKGNEWPRGALLEAIVRLVLEDVGQKR